MNTQDDNEPVKTKPVEARKPHLDIGRVGGRMPNIPLAAAMIAAVSLSGSADALYASVQKLSEKK